MLTWVHLQSGGQFHHGEAELYPPKPKSINQSIINHLIKIVHLIVILKKKSLTKFLSLFHVPGRISTSQGKQYSTNTKYIKQNGTERQIKDPLLVKFMLKIEQFSIIKRNLISFWKLNNFLVTLIETTRAKSFPKLFPVLVCHMGSY